MNAPEPTDRVGDGLPPLDIQRAIREAKSDDEKWTVVRKYYEAQAAGMPPAAPTRNVEWDVRSILIAELPFGEFLLDNYPAVLIRLSFIDDDLRTIAGNLGSKSRKGAPFFPATRRTRGELADELLCRLTGRHFASEAEFRAWLEAPPVSFMGIQDRATRVTFVAEHTGAEISRWSEVREALSQTIKDLAPGQSFNIVLLDYGTFTPMNRGGLAPTTPTAKRQVEDFLDRTTSGTSDAPAGLRFALDQGPEIVFWIEDGNARDDEDVIDLARRHHARIHTIAIPVGRSDGPTEWKETLKKVARETGGSFVCASGRTGRKNR